MADSDKALDDRNGIPLKSELVIEVVPISSLKPHPRNYRRHPQDQLIHIAQNIKANGVYRNIVIAEDGVILAGHGVVEGAKLAGLTEVPVYRMPIPSTSPQALKLLAADNEISHLALNNDRELTNLLKEIKEVDVDGLLGTGFDEAMLANLLFVTRPEGEVKNVDAAAEWAGMPDYEASPKRIHLTLYFDTIEERESLEEQLAVKVTRKSEMSHSAWWPPRDREDLASLRFEQVVAPEGAEA